MPIRRRNPRKKVIIAGIQGLVIGVIGVFLFGVILNLANGEKEQEVEETAEIATPEEEEQIEVSADPVLGFKAKQYGMFTTKESAISFMGEQPSLVKAGIIQADGKFYVWTELFVSEVVVTEPQTLPSFIKPFSVSTESCKDGKVKKVITSLQEENISKKYFDSIVKKEDYPDDLDGIVQAVSAFTDNSSIMRMHLFTHYSERNECVKLSF